MAKKMTEKQIKFADGLIKGLTYKEAFIEAYGRGNKSDKTINRKAFDLAHDERVQKYVQDFSNIYAEEKKKELSYGRDELLQDFIYLRDKSIESIELNGVRQANANALTSSLKNIGDILNLYPDPKQNISISGDINATVNNPYANLTEEELRKLIDDNNDK